MGRKRKVSPSETSVRPAKKATVFDIDDFDFDDAPGYSQDMDIDESISPDSKVGSSEIDDTSEIVEIDEIHEQVKRNVAKRRQEVDLEQLETALAGPHRRGRRTGSGINEKRKEEDLLSPNKNTQKARQRIKKMNPYEKQIHNAKATAASWVSKAIKKWKKTDEFAKIPPTDVAQATKDKRNALFKEREEKFSDSHQKTVVNRLVSEFMTKMNKIRGMLDSEENLLHAYQSMSLKNQNVAEDDAEVWTDDDQEQDEDFIEQHELGQDITGQNDFIEPIFECAFKNMQESGIPHTRIREAGDQSAWLHFRSQIFAAVRKLEHKENRLPWLGRLYRDVGPYSGEESERNLTRRWKYFHRRSKGALATAEGFFTDIDKKLLRFAWNVQKNEWYDLPGPPEWWPDVLGDGSDEDNDRLAWYQDHGFEIGFHCRKNYLWARKGLTSYYAPHDWLASLTWCEHDLVWVPW